MPTRHLPLLLIALLTASAPLAAHAALMHAAQADSVSPITRPLPNPDGAPISTALDAGRFDQPICGDAVLCQEWSHLADDAQAALATARASPFQRATFVVNLAVVGLGLLWAILTRRRLRSTGLMPGRARG